MIAISLFHHCEKVFILMIIYSDLNMEDITDAGYVQAKIVCKNFEIKKLG